MKKLLFSFFLMTFVVGYAQVGINTTTPSPASVLHVEALNTVTTTYGGFMPPIVDFAQRTSMTVGAADDGMMIYYVEGDTRCVQMWNANLTQWEDMYCMPVPAPPSLIYYQDFEAVPNTPELTFSATGGSTSSGTGVRPNSQMYSEGSQGYQSTAGIFFLNFDSVDSSPYTTNSLTFELASFGSGTNSNDGNDYIEVAISTDGSTWSRELRVTGFDSNTWWGFAGSATAAGVYDGDNTPTTYIPISAGELLGPNAYSKVTISNLPASATLFIRIEMKNGSNEIWVVDNVALNLN